MLYTMVDYMMNAEQLCLEATIIYTPKKKKINREIQAKKSRAKQKEY